VWPRSVLDEHILHAFTGWLIEIREEFTFVHVAASATFHHRSMGQSAQSGIYYIIAPSGAAFAIRAILIHWATSSCVIGGQS